MQWVAARSASPRLFFVFSIFFGFAATFAMTTASTAALLVELFVEELPPKSLRQLGAAFASVLFEQLRAQGLVAEAAQLSAFATPRRLAAHISHVAAQAAPRTVRHKLMPAAVGIKDGQPTAALAKKLTALGLATDAALEVEHDGKADILYCTTTAAGVTLAEGAQRALDEALARLPIAKVMRYQLADGWTSVNFVRPAHGLIALHGSAVVPLNALGLSAGRHTQGHRFEAATCPIEIPHADDYERVLREQGAVIASFEARRADISRQLAEQAARAGANMRPIEDEALLDEVTALVERPNVLLCQFEPEFLAVPQECLILTMKANQKYFPLVDAQGKLDHHFLVVSNIAPEDASAVVDGNERVVRPRLADARFFFEQDRKKTLASRVSMLERVVYHNLLGNQGERTERVTHIARAIAQMLGTDEAAVVQAAQLAKTDLLTDMVGEFPELQGIMGRYYARADGLDSRVADAIEDHYKPRFAGDALPRGEVGLCVALADKLETLGGMFAIGNLPTGDKDPFALRRHALGVIRMLVEKDLPLALNDLLEVVWPALQAKTAELPSHAAAPELLQNFIFDRLAVSLREQGYTAQEVDAVLALRPARLSEVPRRLQAVRHFAALPEAAALAAANKRVANILKKAEPSTIAASVNVALFEHAAERDLHSALSAAAPQALSQFEVRDYAASLSTLAALRTAVDAFFADVMVNAEDAAIRANRLGLLRELHTHMNRVADLSRLAA